MLRHLLRICPLASNNAHAHTAPTMREPSPVGHSNGMKNAQAAVELEEDEGAGLDNKVVAAQLRVCAAGGASTATLRRALERVAHVRLSRPD
jgi:hypothetical protein